ncbi:MAG: leucyl aminopeptidase family protein [Saprospiraceae bacterium]|nr:leucyl aminopeptidase family protein [Lewinella sp.]
MTFQFSPSSSFKQDITLVPLASNDHLTTELRQIAQTIGVDLNNLEQDFKAEYNEILPLYTAGRRLFLLGLGKRLQMTDIIRAFRSFAFRNKERLSDKLAINLFHLQDAIDHVSAVEAAVNGLYLGGYQIGNFKSERPVVPRFWQDATEVAFMLPADLHEAGERAAEKGLEMAQTQWSIMDLVNAPSNKKIPADLANWALRSGERYGYQVEVFDINRIRTVGLHALLAVNRGSEEPAAFIVMEYKPEREEGTLPRVGLVGKGVTFDVGGISIKPSTNMHYMKSDMGGAAAVFGTMEMAAKLKLPVHLIGVVPATDNSVDAKSIKPSDVIDSYSGKTIEVIDTDAEGRLILADGLAYMLRHYEPEVLIDLATLTGSTVRTFGYHAAALFTNNDELHDRLDDISRKTGEKFWRLPLWDVYKEDIKSDVADVRNYSGRPLAGAIGAAKFLEVFTADHPAWVHMDIAGVAFTDSEFSSQKSATAYGIRLLTEYLIQLGGKKEG